MPLIFVNHFSHFKFTDMSFVLSSRKTAARKYGSNGLILRPLWDSQSLFKVESAPPVARWEPSVCRWVVTNRLTGKAKKWTLCTAIIIEDGREMLFGPCRLTYWLPLSDKRLVPTAPLVARFWLWTGIVKPTEVVESNAIDQINGATFF